MEEWDEWRKVLGSTIRNPGFLVCIDAIAELRTFADNPTNGVADIAANFIIATNNKPTTRDKYQFTDFVESGQHESDESVVSRIKARNLVRENHKNHAILTHPFYNALPQDKRDAVLDRSAKTAEELYQTELTRHGIDKDMVPKKFSHLHPPSRLYRFKLSTGQ